jgi:hypothetical protein
MLATETTSYVSRLSTEALSKMLREYHAKIFAMMEAMEGLHYASGRYIDLKVEIKRYDEAYNYIHQELISRGENPTDCFIIG